MVRFKNRQWLIWGSVSWIVLFGCSLFLTSPDNLGPFGITIWFGIAFIALTCLLTLTRMTIKNISRSSKGQDSFIRLWISSALLTGYITGLLALNSLHQLDLRDVVLLSLLILLIEFYRRKK